LPGAQPCSDSKSDRRLNRPEGTPPARFRIRGSKRPGNPSKPVWSGWRSQFLAGSTCARPHNDLLTGFPYVNCRTKSGRRSQMGTRGRSPRFGSNMVIVETRDGEQHTYAAILGDTYRVPLSPLTGTRPPWQIGVAECFGLESATEIRIDKHKPAHQ
jgi:hypothetical protein